MHLRASYTILPILIKIVASCLIPLGYSCNSEQSYHCRKRNLNWGTKVLEQFKSLTEHKGEIKV